MSIKLASSGSYNVRASEMAHIQDRTPKAVSCAVHFLDDTVETFEVDKRGKAQQLLEKVFEHLELVEKDYFGLQYVDLAPGDDSLRWLDPLKTIKKQCRGPAYDFFFRVKFYVSDPSKLAEEYTRYHFFLQVKRDILSGKLVCSEQVAVLLASYAVQSELGDFNPDEHKDGYLSEFAFIPDQSRDFEKQVAEKHKQHRGQTPADAESNFLEKAKRLEMYGVDLHNARDQSNIDIQLGVTSAGLVVFQNNIKINTFSWAKIVKISFKRKQFFIQLRREVADNIEENDGKGEKAQNEPVENLIGFNMVSYRSCKNLWKSCVEHHTFFRLHHPNPPAKKLFTMGSKFRYRSPSKRYRRTVGAVSREAILEENRYIDAYRQMSKSQTFSAPTSSPANSTNASSSSTGTVSSSSNHTFSRHDGVGGQVRATLPHDYKTGRTSWNDGNQSEKSEE
ncbi:Tyrosine-protein phosphatase non-receptor type 4 [Bulinus truncatus]|nr:Tyrosine-protein phosphatase non-receptor type 4 [Bulinus truncatus]